MSRTGKRLRAQSFTPLTPRPDSCNGKACYTKKEAQTMVNEIMRKGRGLMRTYHCEECNTWHLSHKL